MRSYMTSVMSRDMRYMYIKMKNFKSNSLLFQQYDITKAIKIFDYF